MITSLNENFKLKTQYKIGNDNVRVVVKGLNADGVEEKIGYYYNRHAVEEKLPMLKKSLAAGMRESEQRKLKLKEIPTFEADIFLSYASNTNLDEAKKKLLKADVNKLLEVTQRLEIDLTRGTWRKLGKAVLSQCDPDSFDYLNLAAAINFRMAAYDVGLARLAQDPKLGIHFTKLSSEVVGDLLQSDDLCLDESELLAAVQAHFAAIVQKLAATMRAAREKCARLPEEDAQAPEEGAKLDRTDPAVMRICESLRWEHIDKDTIILDIAAAVPVLDDTTRGIVLAQKVNNKPVLGKETRPQRRRTEIHIDGKQVNVRCYLKNLDSVRIGRDNLSLNFSELTIEQEILNNFSVKVLVSGKVVSLGKLNKYNKLEIPVEYFDASGAVHLSLTNTDHQL